MIENQRNTKVNRSLQHFLEDNYDVQHSVQIQSSSLETLDTKQQ